MNLFATADRPWHHDWSTMSDLRAAVQLPSTMDFDTSGSTGPSRTWRHRGETLWTEAGLLADLVRPHRPEAVLASAPPRHLYGALATVLLPARLRLPVWYRPQYFGALPPPGGRRWLVVAVPWTFAALARREAWLDQVAHLTVLHSSATVPETAARLLERLGGRAEVVEVFGATETGGVAHRVWRPDPPPWRLFPDVELRTEGPGEQPLRVRGPRLAEGLAEWTLDDFVVPVPDRGFRFAGRRSRLVKVNGRRVDLDVLEAALRAALPGMDLAALPVADPTSGEHVDLLVVPEGRTEDEVRAAIAHLAPRPRRVLLVPAIDRSATGKARRVRLTACAGTPPVR
ncbi:acyl-CoA synthetase (AMP-forming)/AMP-acid ligase II [Crossiella equi]|uniref:Acyl-CoA synthetase (AMP-forming)/AMP-acid ligase II n=1 Tax=Crossiella equi TaxID=130796 RepID=A0ABS5AA98_9PSEU|nr:class I adenylate-forming enzyme family protein [Crossiella equi]MBP2473508.1 acyl-CoA synthetase (AMP-forming)/AMP-acid ligase II [Crossiella equi]